MPISGATLAPSVVSAAGSPDTIGKAAWAAIAAVIGTWLLTGVPTATSADPLIAVGALVTGSGAIVYADAGSSLGVQLAAAAGSVDAVGLEKWAAIGLALGSWMNANAQIDPTNLVAVVGGPSPNAVTGAGGVKFASSGLGDALATAATAVDAPGIERWNDIGDAIIEHMTDLGIVAPGAMASPPAGGPVTGVGVLS